MTTVARVGGATLLAWLTYVLHNVVDLPDLDVLAPEYTVATVLYAALFLLWALVPTRATRLLFVAWVWLQIVGGGVISVLPLPFLPFEPAQTPLHYAMHGLLIVGHLPLARELERGRT